jgi:hypothetical protein
MLTVQHLLGGLGGRVSREDGELTGFDILSLGFDQAIKSLINCIPRQEVSQIANVGPAQSEILTQFLSSRMVTVPSTL